MNMRKISSPDPKRRYLWLFAALLPLALFGVIIERNSWRPRSLVITPFHLSEDIKVWNFAWSPDSKTIAVANRRNVSIVNVQTWRVIKKIRTETSELSDPFLFAPDNKTIFLFDMKSGIALDELSGEFTKYESKRFSHTNTGWGRISTNIRSDAVSPDGKIEVVPETEAIPYLNTPGQFDYITHSLSLSDRKGKTLNMLWIGTFHGMVMWTQFSNHGSLIFAKIPAEDEKTTILHGWQVADGKEIITFPLPTDSSGSLDELDMEISPDGKTAAAYSSRFSSNSASKRMVFYDLKSHKLLRTVQNPDETLIAQYSPDGNYIAVGGKHGTLTLWRVQ